MKEYKFKKFRITFVSHPCNIHVEVEATSIPSAIAIATHDLSNHFSEIDLSVIFANLIDVKAEIY